jgi:hypothetical protein
MLPRVDADFPASMGSCNDGHHSLGGGLAMDKNTQLAMAPMYEIIKQSPDELYRELGLVKVKVANDATGSDQFGLKVEYSAEAFGPVDDLVSIGKQYFARVSRRAYGIICGNDPQDADERKKVRDSFELGKQAVAAALAAALVSSLAMAPAVAVLVAAIAVTIFGDAAYDTMCQVWKDNLPKVPE